MHRMHDKKREKHRAKQCASGSKTSAEASAKNSLTTRKCYKLARRRIKCSSWTGVEQLFCSSVRCFEIIFSLVITNKTPLLS